MNGKLNLKKIKVNFFRRGSGGCWTGITKLHLHRNNEHIPWHSFVSVIWLFNFRSYRPLTPSLTRITNLTNHKLEKRMKNWRKLRYETGKCLICNFFLFLSLKGIDIIIGLRCMQLLLSYLAHASHHRKNKPSRRRICENFCDSAYLNQIDFTAMGV